MEKKAKLSESLRKEIQDTTNVLSRAVRFMNKIIQDDIDDMEAYYELYGDIKYRPPKNGNEKELGNPTEVDLVLKADSLGLPLKRLIDTLSAIEHKLGGLDTDPQDDSYTDEEMEEHEADLEARAQAVLDKALANKKDK